MRRLDLDLLSQYLKSRTDVAFAVCFGSGQTGDIRPGSDLDLGVYFDPPPSLDELLSFLAEISKLLDFDDLDYTDLRTANPLLAFEAISGRFLCKNSREVTAGYCAQVCREAEYARAEFEYAAGWEF